jgi:hypothetical protein
MMSRHARWLYTRIHLSLTTECNKARPDLAYAMKTIEVIGLGRECWAGDDHCHPGSYSPQCHPTLYEE